MKIKHIIDVGELGKAFRYDPETGVLYRRNHKDHKGEDWPCGTHLVTTKYLVVHFRGMRLGAQRIAWALAYDEYPVVEVDHINGNRLDNRICNLRLATSAQNARNSRLNCCNKTGVKGVSHAKRGKPWRVKIETDKKIYITQFDCFGKAVKHAKLMRVKFHQEFARIA